MKVCSKQDKKSGWAGTGRPETHVKTLNKKTTRIERVTNIRNFTKLPLKSTMAPLKPQGLKVPLPSTPPKKNKKWIEHILPIFLFNLLKLKYRSKNT